MFAQSVVWVVLFLLIAGPVHECAHAVAAWRMGDGTARMFGRITLNPIVHFDPVGGSLLAVSALLGGAGFGWAKPTPVNPYNLRGRHADSIVAAAGPVSNLVLAALFAIPFRILWANGVAPNNTSVADPGLTDELIAVAPRDGIAQVHDREHDYEVLQFPVTDREHHEIGHVVMARRVDGMLMLFPHARLVFALALILALGVAAATLAKARQLTGARAA